MLLKNFLKSKGGLELAPLLYFAAFWRKVSLLREILGNMCIAIVCKPGCDFRNFESNIIFLIKPFFYMTKSQDRYFNILRAKRDFTGEIKAFLIIFKGLSMKQLKEIFLSKWESDFNLKAELATATYFKVSTPVRSQRH